MFDMTWQVHYGRNLRDFISKSIEILSDRVWDSGQAGEKGQLKLERIGSNGTFQRILPSHNN